MLNHNFFHSLVLPLAADFYPPAICNFCWRHLLHMDFPFFSNCISSCHLQLLLKGFSSFVSISQAFISDFSSAIPSSILNICGGPIVIYVVNCLVSLFLALLS